MDRCAQEHMYCSHLTWHQCRMALASNARRRGLSDSEGRGGCCYCCTPAWSTFSVFLFLWGPLGRPKLRLSLCLLNSRFFVNPQDELRLFIICCIVLSFCFQQEDAKSGHITLFVFYLSFISHYISITSILLEETVGMGQSGLTFVVQLAIWSHFLRGSYNKFDPLELAVVPLDLKCKAYTQRQTQNYSSHGNQNYKTRKKSITKNEKDDRYNIITFMVLSNSNKLHLWQSNRV